MPKPLYNKILGTNSDETLIGKSGSDEITAFDGNDKLYGMAGDDLLFGGNGTDTVDGGAGADIMYGGAGSDLYRVDNYLDIVSEESQGVGIDDGGVDTVQSTISYALGTFVEKLELTGSAAINATGNALGNTIKGNAGDNVISGGGGNDDLRGGAGNDMLIGGSGKDTLLGGTGADTFVLWQPDATNPDRIADFIGGEDRLLVYGSMYGLSAGGGIVDGLLDESYFALISGSTNRQGTVAGHGQFLYNTTTSTLMWDADGAGSAQGVAVATFASVGGVPVVLSASDIAVSTSQPTVSVRNVTMAAAAEDGKIAFEITLSEPTYTDVTVTYSTTSATATADSDFIGMTSATVIIPAGSVNAVAIVDLIDDNIEENAEDFSLVLNSATDGAGTPLTITGGTASATIVDEGPMVVNIIDTRPIGSTDPSGLAYVPGHGLFLSDSEVDETPFLRSNNLFKLDLDGSDPVGYSLFNFTHEPTGLAYDPTTGRLYISDDDQYTIFWVDPDNPTVLGGQFTTPAAADDPEDIAVNPTNGNIFIVNGTSHSIVEVTATGQQVGAAIVLPVEITDPEALAYDPQHDLFYVGGDFSSNIWAVDRNGNIVETISVLEGYRNEVSGTRAHVKDLEFAPTSDPTDDPMLMSLYVADYGNNHPELWGAPSDDGRIIEVHLGDQAPLATWLLV